MLLSFAYLAFPAVLRLLVGRRRSEVAKDVELLVCDINSPCSEGKRSALCCAGGRPDPAQERVLAVDADDLVVSDVAEREGQEPGRMDLSVVPDEDDLPSVARALRLRPGGGFFG